MEHKVIPTANATAATTAIISIVCAAVIVLFPNLSMTIAQSWFHGLDISKIAVPNITPGSFILGLTTATIGGWLVGYVFANIYNYFVRKR